MDTTSNRLGGTVAEKNKRLADILTGIAGINFGNFKNNDIDAFVEIVMGKLLCL